MGVPKGRFQRQRGGRVAQGFSLIELLIVVAIIAALVGVAVPFFQNNINEANQAKARQDLALLKGAVSRYQQLERKMLAGTRLEPLLGKYLQDLPVDPWGNPYLYDGTGGFLGTYGADGLPGGSGGDADIYGYSINVDGEFWPITPNFPIRAQYQGPWGRPRPPDVVGFLPDFTKYSQGNKLIVSFHRPLAEPRPDLLPGDFRLSDPNTQSIPNGTAYLTDPAHFLALTWRSAADPTAFGPNVDPAHRPQDGVLVLRATRDNRTFTTGFGIRPSTRLHFTGYEDPSSLPAAIVATYTSGAEPASPLDPAVYGDVVEDFMMPILGPPEPGGPGSGLSDDEDLDGLRIERY